MYLRLPLSTHRRVSQTSSAPQTRPMSVYVNKRRRTMRRPPASILLILLVIIVLFPILQRPIHLATDSLTSETRETLRNDSSDEITHFNTPKCEFITPPSMQWSYNSRSHCVFPDLCITEENLLLRKNAPVCVAVTASYHPYHVPKPCTTRQFSRITCAYTPGMLSGKPSCESPTLLTEPLSSQLPHHVVVVPHYPYPANIYHFANSRTTLLHHIRHSIHPPSVILFRGASNRNAWQASFHEIIISAIQTMLPYVKFLYLPPGERFCGKNVTLLGRRGHTNVWPFPNTTIVDPNGNQLPVESLEFRRTFYESFGIPHQLPVDKQEQQHELIIPHPPLVLGYARRLGPGAVTGGNVHAIGTMRRFSETDEEWFQAMLEEETTLQNVSLHVFTTSAEDPLSEQVTNFAGLGGVIGIHGANLVNTMFMPPLALLIEVFPAKVTSLCYYAGGNAGLRYIRFESADAASAEESGCSSGRCLVLNRQRLVKIDRESERERLRNNVREGLSYLTGLRKRFPNGIPVVKDRIRGVYEVVD